jgi:hypothetical protein
MWKLTGLFIVMLCSGCIFDDHCYDTKADPISKFDKAFLPYTTDGIYLFTDLTSDNTVSFKCDTVFEYWQNIFVDGDCDFYALTHIRKTILSSVINDNEDRITISSSIVSSKVPSSFSYYTARNKCRQLLIDISYTNSNASSNSHYSCYIVKSSPDLSYYDTGGALADTSLTYFDTKNINGESYTKVNRLSGLNSITHARSDTLYISNDYGIIRFKINELNYDLLLPDLAQH